MVDRIRVLLGLRHADDSTALALSHQPWRSDVYLYFFRWWVGEAPASITGTLLPMKNFFLYSASLGLLIWGLSVEFTGKFFACIDSKRHDMRRYYQLFASPLILMAGHDRFSFWLILPRAYLHAHRVMLSEPRLCSSFVWHYSTSSEEHHTIRADICPPCHCPPHPFCHTIPQVMYPPHQRVLGKQLENTSRLSFFSMYNQAD